MSRYIYGLEAGVRFLAEARDLSLVCSIRTDSVAHPISYLTDTWGSFRGVKRPRREVDHSPSTTAENKNGGAIPPLPDMSSWRDA
jgi:hypothetical protein